MLRDAVYSLPLILSRHGFGPRIHLRFSVAVPDGKMGYAACRRSRLMEAPMWNVRIDPRKLLVVEPENALPGRQEKMSVPGEHFVTGERLRPPFREGTLRLVVGMGCFWGAERTFWKLPGVETTAVGYAGGSTSNPTYEEVCSGQTGHTEVVLVTYDPANVELETLLRTFWENHDPTQGMRQGNDVGTQYRSALFYHSEAQRGAIFTSRDVYQQLLSKAGYGAITTEIAEVDIFYYAEAYHQQYLAKNPGGYCGLGGTRVSYSVDIASTGSV